MGRNGEELVAELRAFVTDHPDGWDHGAWEGLLHELGSKGISTTDREAIGRRLEKERLALTLETLDVKGLGPRRREAIVTSYERVWELKQAAADELAQLPAFTSKIAEDLAAALRA